MEFAETRYGISLSGAILACPCEAAMPNRERTSEPINAGSADSLAFARVLPTNGKLSLFGLFRFCERRE